MICTKHKVIFIHIPKTGGTSVEYMFGMLERFGKNGNFVRNLNIEPTHMPAEELSLKHPKWFNEFYKFTTVRNSWTKVYSGYIMYYNIMFRGTGSAMTFDKWLHNKWKPRVSQSKISEQLDFITINGEISMDRIMRFENLKEEWESLCEYLKKPIEPLVHMTKYKNKPITFHEAYTQENIDLVAELCKKDIEYFGYDFPAKTTS